MGACKYLGFSEMAIYETLDRPERGMVIFLGVPFQCELVAKLGMQGVGAIAHDRQPTALCRAILGEGGDDDMPAGFHSVQHRFNIGLPLLLGGKKMEHGPVVPDVERMPGQGDAGDIRL